MCQAKDSFGDRSDQQSLEPCSAVRRHDNKVCFKPLCTVRDAISWVAELDLDVADGICLSGDQKFIAERPFEPAIRRVPNQHTTSDLARESPRHRLANYDELVTQ